MHGFGVFYFSLALVVIPLFWDKSMKSTLHLACGTKESSFPLKQEVENYLAQLLTKKDLCI